jgi:GTP-binding protein
MKIESAKFIKGAVGPDKIFENHFPQVAIIGRSNAGKSSLINALTGQKGLAIASSAPGRTKQINLFLINEAFYLVDLPGYGYSRAPRAVAQEIEKLINWYLFLSGYPQRKIILIVDANIGPTKDDLEILSVLDEYKKNIVVVANKVDKLKNSEYKKQMDKIRAQIGNHKMIPCSTIKKTGIKEILAEMLA